MATATPKKTASRSAKPKAAATKPKAAATKPKAKAGAAKPKAGDEAMDRLSRAIDAAQAAVKDLRGGADKATSDLLHDLEKTLDHARANAQRVTRAVKKDLKRA